MYLRGVVSIVTALVFTLATSEQVFDLNEVTKVYRYGDLSPIADVLQRVRKWYSNSGTAILSKLAVSTEEMIYFENHSGRALKMLKRFEKVLREGKLCQKSGIDLAAMEIVSKDQVPLIIEHRAVRDNNWCTPLEKWTSMAMRLNDSSKSEGTILASETGELVCKNDVGQVKSRAPASRQMLMPLNGLGKLIEEFASSHGIQIQTPREDGHLVVSTSAARYQTIFPSADALLRSANLPGDLSICTYSDNANFDENIKKMAIFFNKFIDDVSEQMRSEENIEIGEAFTRAAKEAKKESSGIASCFPGDATVELADGTTERMRDLQVGSTVKVGLNDYSPVLMFTHQTPDRLAMFVELTLHSGHSILLTPGHMIYYANGDLKCASNVIVGDILRLGDGKTSAVRGRSTKFKRGLYNPQTTGDIVVNGILASTYTSAIEPTVAHSLLAPFRITFKAFIFMYSRSLQLYSHLLLDTACI